MLGNRTRHLHCSFVVELLLATLAFPLWLLDQTLTKVAAIDLPGPKGQRFDYLTMADEDHYLLSAHLGPGLQNGTPVARMIVYEPVEKH